MSYQCVCGEIFEPDQAEIVPGEQVTSEAWGVVETTVDEKVICPSCKSDEVEEIVLCQTCGAKEAAGGSDDCDECDPTYTLPSPEAVQERVRRSFRDHLIDIATHRTVIHGLNFGCWLRKNSHH